jgi:hypothetical protein
MTTLLLSAIFALSATADAAPKPTPDRGHSLALLLNPIPVEANDLHVFGGGDGLFHKGVRGSLGLNQTLSLVGSWSVATEASEVDVWVDGATDESLTFVSQIRAQQAGLGVEARWRATAWLAPYALAMGDLTFATTRFDTDPGDDDNLTEVTDRAVAPGFWVGGGLDVHTRKPLLGKVYPMLYLELGYTLQKRLEFDARGGTTEIENGPIEAKAGAISFRGFSPRWGLGLRF